MFDTHVCQPIWFSSSRVDRHVRYGPYHMTVGWYRGNAMHCLTTPPPPPPPRNGPPRRERRWHSALRADVQMVRPHAVISCAKHHTGQ